MTRPGPRRRRTLFGTVFRIAFIMAMLSLSVASVYLWWRGGMWTKGEMPTHGMQLTLLGCGGAVAFLLLYDYLGRRGTGRDGERPSATGCRNRS